MAESVWESIAAAADGTTITYDASTKTLSAAGGSMSSSDVITYATTGELEDLTIRTGSFENAAAGWNTFSFPVPFEGVPHVIATVESGYTIEIKGVTEAEFLYKVTVGSSEVSATTGSYYVFTSKSVSTTYMTQIPIVTAVSASGSTTTSDAVTIRYTAVEYGGE